MAGLAASTAGAQTSPQASPGLSESLTGPARAAFDSGKLLFANQDFGGALTEFAQAYEGSKDPRLLFNMAICEKNLHHYARMQTLLRRYQRDAGPRLTGENRAVVDDALHAIDNLVGAVSITVNEADATVSLDGANIATTPLSAPLAVDVGHHSIAVSKSGFDTVVQAIDVAGGNGLSVTLSLVKTTHLGHLTITCDAAATIVVDTSPSVDGRFDATLASGTHNIRVIESGKIPYTASVELRDGEKRTLAVSLENEHRTLIWPWFVGGAAVLAGAAVGGYFLLKPGSASTTAPPTGALPTVQLKSIQF